MSTFIGQLVGFAVIILLVWRYVVPPVRKMMADQQDTVRRQLADSAAAADRLAEASRAHANRSAAAAESANCRRTVLCWSAIIFRTGGTTYRQTSKMMTANPTSCPINVDISCLPLRT